MAAVSGLCPGHHLHVHGLITSHLCAEGQELTVALTRFRVYFDDPSCNRDVSIKYKKQLKPLFFNKAFVRHIYTCIN